MLETDHVPRNREASHFQVRRPVPASPPVRRLLVPRDINLQLNPPLQIVGEITKCIFQVRHIGPQCLEQGKRNQ